MWGVYRDTQVLIFWRAGLQGSLRGVLLAGASFAAYAEVDKNWERGRSSARTLHGHNGRWRADLPTRPPRPLAPCMHTSGQEALGAACCCVVVKECHPLQDCSVVIDWGLFATSSICRLHPCAPTGWRHTGISCRQHQPRGLHDQVGESREGGMGTWGMMTARR